MKSSNALLGFKFQERKLKKKQTENKILSHLLYFDQDCDGQWSHTCLLCCYQHLTVILSRLSHIISMSSNFVRCFIESTYFVELLTSDWCMLEMEESIMMKRIVQTTFGFCHWQ